MSKAEDFVKKVLASVPLLVPAILEEDAPTSTNRIRVGDFYSIDGDPYILAQIAPMTCAILNLHGGNRWNEGVGVGNVDNITQEEFSRIAPIDRYEVRKLTIT